MTIGQPGLAWSLLIQNFKELKIKPVKYIFVVIVTINQSAC